MCLFSLVMAFGCGGDNGGGPTDTAASLTAQGWTRFEKGEYMEAIDKFNQALGKDADYADAYNGLGWSYAKLDTLNKALLSFGECLTRDDELTEGHAGCAPVYRDFEIEGALFGAAHPLAFGTAHFDSAIAFASEALSQDSEFEFSHGTSFDWRDLRIIIAQSYFAKGKTDPEDYFLLAKAQVDILNPGNDLDPESDTFVAELAEEIERLESEYGG
jgi:tetratricopeptide (TPR) repeat protein